MMMQAARSGGRRQARAVENDARRRYSTCASFGNARKQFSLAPDPHKIQQRGNGDEKRERGNAATNLGLPHFF